MEKSGIFINGKFIECDVNNLEIIIKGEIESLNVGNENTIINNNNTMIMGNVKQQVFHGKISGGTFGIINNYGSTSQIVYPSSIKINVDGNINYLNTIAGDVYCKDTSHIETTSGDINVSGNVSGSIESISGDIEIKGSFSGNVSTITGDIIHK